MAESVPKKLNMLVKRDDGSVWTIGSDAANMVTTDTKQDITGEKTFTVPPKIKASATEPEHAVNRAYLDSIISAKEPFNCSVTVHAAAASASAWVVMSNLEIHLANGKKLKCLHVDNTQPTSATEPVKCVFGLIDEATAIDAAPEKQASAFFTSYKLKENELWGSVTYGKLLDKQWTEYASYSAPFFSAQYGAQGAGTDLKPMLRIGIEQAPAAVKKIKLTWDGSYLPSKAQASLDGCGLPVSSKLYDSVTAGEMEIPFDLVKLTGLVTLDSEQTITALKNFNVLPKSKVDPDKPEDFVNKKYADYIAEQTLTNAFGTGPYNCNLTLDINDGNKWWVRLYKVEFHLDDGKKLKCLHCDEVMAANATEPVRCVYKVVEESESFAEPEWHPASFFETYELKEGELWGSVTYGPQLDPKWSTQTAYRAPFSTTTWYGVHRDDGVRAPAIKFGIEKCPAAIAKVSVYWDPSYKSTEAQATLRGCGAAVSSPLLTAPSGDHDMPFKLLDICTLGTEQELTAKKTFKILPQSEATPADAKDLATKKYVDEKVAAGGGGGGSGAAPTNMVTTDTEQSITAVKTFAKLPKSTAVPADNAELVNKKYVDDKQGKVVTLDTDQTISATKTFGKLPKSTAEPADDAELVTKKYVDAKVAAGGSGSKAGNTTISIFIEPEGNLKAGINQQKFSTADGKFLGVVYSDKTQVSTATKPLRYVFKLMNDGEPLQSEEKDAAFFDTYQLKEGEYFANVTPSHLCSSNWSDSSSNPYHNPFGSYESTPNNSQVGLWKFLEYTFIGLPVEFVKFNYALWGHFNKIQIKVAASSKFFVSKIYTKDEDGLTQNSAHEVPFDYTSTNFVTVESDQTISGEKTFTALPRTEIVPTDPAHLVNKAYVDPVQGYSITIYATPNATSGNFGFSALRLYLANGARLYPRLTVEGDEKTMQGPARYIWTLESQNTGDFIANSKEERELDKYKLTSNEFDGAVTYPHLLGKFTYPRDRYFQIGSTCGVSTATANGEQPLLRIDIKGSLPPITKVEAVSDSNADYVGVAMRAEVCAIGDKPKKSQNVQITGASQKVEMIIDEAFVPDPYYVNRFEPQSIQGTKTFLDIPAIKKPAANYSFGAANNAVIFGDLSGSIAQPKAKEQILDIGITSHQDKTHQGGGVWVYTFTIDVKVGGLSVKVRRPDTLEEEELFLKACASTSDMGYVGILTNQKPDGYPNHTIEEMDAAAFGRYTLRDGEYLAKCYFATVSKGSISDEAYQSAKKSGSQRIKDLFQPYKDSSWYNHKSSPTRFPQSSEGPAALVQLAIFNAPMISSWTVSNQSTDRYTDYVHFIGEETGRGYASGQHLTANWAKDAPDLQMQTVNVLGVVVDLKKKLAELEKKNTTLEEKVKKLEDAAPKP